MYRVLYIVQYSLQYISQYIEHCVVRFGVQKKGHYKLKYRGRQIPKQRLQYRAQNPILESNFGSMHSDRRATSCELVYGVNLFVFGMLYIKIQVFRGIESNFGVNFVVFGMSYMKVQVFRGVETIFGVKFWIRAI